MPASLERIDSWRHSLCACGAGTCTCAPAGFATSLDWIILRKREHDYIKQVEFNLMAQSLRNQVRSAPMIGWLRAESGPNTS